MKDSERTMIEARRNLVRKMMSEGRSEDEIFTAYKMGKAEKTAE